MLHEIWSQVGKDWRDALGQSGIAAFERLSRFLQSEAEAGRQTYPAMGDVFKALRLTPLREVKLLILGQGPYFGEAHGLSFRGMRFPMFGALTTADIERVRFEDGAMTVAGRGISPANCNPLGAVVGDPSYKLSVEVGIRETAQGGLLLSHSRRAYCGLGRMVPYSHSPRPV